MGRTAKPAALHEISGSYNINPERRKKNAPEPGRGIGPAPDYLSDQVRGCWDELVENCCPQVLGNSDRVWLERAASLLAKAREKGFDFPASSETALQGYLSKLGMNPCDRMKITVREPNDKDPADKYF